MFIDRAVINVLAGKGGKGCQSFYRDKYSRPPKNLRHWKGKPDGGDGGKGGDVIVRADSHLYSLLDFQYKRHFYAKNGKHGGSNKKKGEHGQDCVIKVPIGTIVKNFDNQYLLGDLDQDQKSLIVAKGGLGGSGSAHKLEATDGNPGDELKLSLELKLISDIGIIGLPNVGKSSLINCISNSKSRVANFPFTTKSPALGVIDYQGIRIVAADIPGIIKDAHQNKGLGLQFLRHIQRTKALLHVLDMSGSEGRDVYEDYLTLNNELGCYDKAMLDKPQVVVANKMDLAGSKENLRKFLKQVKIKVIPISALRNEGIDILLEEIRKLVKA